MYKQIRKPLNLKIYKAIFSALAAVILALCSMLVFAGCSNNIMFKDAIQIAKEDFGCKKILWVASARSNLALTSDIKYTEDGVMYLEERVFPEQGGYYVFGLDKNGKEVYVAVPRYKSSKCKPAKIDWPFDYSFTQMLDFAGEYGYKYADGLDGRIDEFIEEQYKYGINTNSIRYFKEHGSPFSDDGFIDSLDVKFVFEFHSVANEEAYYDYYIVQQKGELVMYKVQHSNREVKYRYSRSDAFIPT